MAVFARRIWWPWSITRPEITGQPVRLLGGFTVYRLYPHMSLKAPFKDITILHNMGVRDYKNFAPGNYYHIYNRGVGKMDIFKEDQDYSLFLSRLKENIYPDVREGRLRGRQGRSHSLYVRKLLPPGSFSLIAYCLMPNHFHLLIKQNSDIPITKLILKVCTSYSKIFNKKYERIGTLFQDRFKTEHIGNNEYLLWLSAYIHLNPRVANLVQDDLDWKWSSYSEYLNLPGNKLCEIGIVSEQFKDTNNYRKIVENSFEPVRLKKYAILEVLNPEFDRP